MNNNINENTNNDDIDYSIICKNKNDILNDISFESEEDKLLCDSIITSLEKDVASAIKDMKITQIPFIGCVRINPVRKELGKAKKHFKSLRKSLTKEQYKEYVSDYVIDLKTKQKEEERKKLIFTYIRRNNKKKYENLVIKCGRAYAELFIMSIYWLKEIPFDKDWEDQYTKLINNKNI